jgi:hypothetical protein
MTNLTEQERMLAEVITNITREKNVVVNLPPNVSLLTITINLAESQSVYFCKKINERVVAAIRGAYRLVVVEYKHEGDTLYSFTQTYEDKNEGFNFDHNKGDRI